MNLFSKSYRRLKNRFKPSKLGSDSFSELFYSSVFRAASLEDVANFYQWESKPKINAADFQPLPFATYHLNGRRMKDALLIASAASNAPKGDGIEIGTSTGVITSLIAENMSESTVHTLDILPSQTNAGKHITHILDEEKIGSIYRSRGLGNIRQYYCDSLHWAPEVHDASFALIDGCHDFHYVVNDTMKVISCMKKGAYLCWHDFNPELASNFPWIRPVCNAIDHLIQSRVINAPVLYLQDSFTGICRIE